MCTRCCCPCGPHTAKRVLVSRDVPFVLSAGRQDEEVIKSSWVHQMQRAKERPNLVHWRDELVSITKDSSEDFEDATLSVELMRVRCDVCYHEKSVSLEVDVTVIWHAYLTFGVQLATKRQCLAEPKHGVCLASVASQAFDFTQYFRALLKGHAYACLCWLVAGRRQVLLERRLLDVACFFWLLSHRR